MYEEMIDSCTPEELADPALMAANLQSAYLSGEHPSLWDDHEDPHTADAYWTKGKSKGKGKGKFKDLHNVDPILTRLATAEHMDNVGPAFQNLVDLINEKRYTGTLRELVGLEGAPRGTFADRNAPMYRLRRQRRVEIFNHAMRADPCNGSMHTLESLVSYMDQAGETLVQIAQCIRIYNYGRPRRENKLTVRQLVLDVIRLYTQSTSAVVFTVPARAVAINTILGFSALFDVLRGHVENKV